MNARSTIRKRRSEAGIALLVSIFILLLISVVAIALIVASGTESSLAGNYRSATGVYYASLAGLEEARGRLLGNNPSSFKITAPSLISTPLLMGHPVYIINPVGSETVAPWDPGSTYPDGEFNPEFLSSGFSLPNPSPSTTSVSTVAGVQGPLYKWVRINAVSENSLNIDIDSDGTKDNNPLYYDGIQSKLKSTSAGGAKQVFEITSFAVLPNGSQKLLQYLVALVPVNFPDFPTGLMSFPAALTIAGGTNSVAFSPPTSNASYWVSGVDLTSVPFCTAGPAVDAIGVFDNPDIVTVNAGIPGPMQTKYDGKPNPPNPRPDVVNVIANGSFPASLQTPSKLDNLAQTIIANADAIAPPGGGNATGSDLTPLLSSGMSSTNPMTVVVNGDLDLTGWHNTGYGLLLVTGNLNYDPDASWNGIVLVIGKGTVTGSRSGSGEFDGAFFVAKTRDSSGILLPDPNLGKASVTFATNMGSNGIRYSSCWIKASQPTANFKILSFHEIPQP